MAKKKEIDWNEGIIDYMPEEEQIRVLKEFEKAILKAKETPDGRRRLAFCFGGKPSKYMPSSVNKSGAM